MQDLDVKKSKMPAFFCVSWCEKGDVTQKSAVRNTPNTKYLQNRHFPVYICTRVRQSDRKDPYHSAKWRGRPMPPLSP